MADPTATVTGTDEQRPPLPEGDERSAAREGDTVVGIDIHIIDVPSPAGPVPTPTPHPFKGKLDRELSGDVQIEDRPAATVGSLASNEPHVPIGGTFHNPPKDEAKVQRGAETVLVNDKPIARQGDPCYTCSDPMDLPTGIVIAASSVVCGDGPTTADARKTS